MYKILIADNCSVCTRLLSHCFQKECCEVFTAEDGLEAMNILDLCDIDILVTDIIMPKIGSSGDSILNAG